MKSLVENLFDLVIISWLLLLLLLPVTITGLALVALFVVCKTVGNF